jgi:hypothetical protein
VHQRLEHFLSDDVPHGHNNGPPLDDDRRPWGTGPVRNFFVWRAARRQAFRGVPTETAVRRARKAEALGLTYDEYTLEILERGRYLQPEDAERIMQIKLKRPLRD